MSEGIRTHWTPSWKMGPKLGLFGSSEIQGPGQHLCQICSLNHKKRDQSAPQQRYIRKDFT